MQTISNESLHSTNGWGSLEKTTEITEKLPSVGDDTVDPNNAYDEDQLAVSTEPEEELEDDDLDESYNDEGDGGDETDEPDMPNEEVTDDETIGDEEDEDEFDDDDTESK